MFRPSDTVFNEWLFSKESFRNLYGGSDSGSDSDEGDADDNRLPEPGGAENRSIWCKTDTILLSSFQRIIPLRHLKMALKIVRADWVRSFSIVSGFLMSFLLRFARTLNVSLENGLVLIGPGIKPFQLV